LAWSFVVAAISENVIARSNSIVTN